VTSRIAKAFRFGGPSFIVSGEEASGLRALEIGVRSLQNREARAVLIGAVDFAGDIRSMISSNAIRPFSRKGRVRPFDEAADGPLPGEGAAALVLKPLREAARDGDRICAVIKGIGAAGGTPLDSGAATRETYRMSMERTFDDAGVSPASISYVETHGSGCPSEDPVESGALNAFFDDASGGAGTLSKTIALGSVKSNIDHTGAVSGLASVVKTALILYQEIIPPLAGFSTPAAGAWSAGKFHMPKFPQFWLRDRIDGPRRALAGAMTRSGECFHAILEGVGYEPDHPAADKIEIERKHPLGGQTHGLFVIEG
jgi:acyl transferase domain-containing protein